MGERQRPGVRDVAALAGVSTQTVSRVINGHESIRPETRRRVEEAMAALEYRVNNAARALGTRSSRTLGVIVSDAALYGPAVGAAALETAARAAGLWVVTTSADATDEASVDEALSHLLGQGVDGVLLVGMRTGTRAALAARAGGVPVVALFDEDGADVQRSAVRLAVDHLVALGHRRIARVGGPEDWLDERVRADAFAHALAAHDMSPAGVWAGDWSAASGAALAENVAAAVSEPGGPTAVAVANDQMALGLMAGLEARGVAVPGRVSVVGFDDNPDAAYYRPALTTVRLDAAAEAARCVAQVRGLDWVASRERPVLVERASTTAVPTS